MTNSPTFSYELATAHIYAHLLYRIHPDQAKRLDREKVASTLKKAVQQANSLLQNSECNIVVLANPDFVIPEEGIGAMSWGTDWIRIDIDANNKDLAKNIAENLPPAIAHELHHVARERSVGYGKTLGEVLITEGLAQAFEEFLYEDRKPLYAHYLSKKELATVWKKAEKNLGSKDFDHNEWFYGSGNLKRWAGYSLGYDIVSQFLQTNSKHNPVTLVGTSAREIISRSKYNPAA